MQALAGTGMLRWRKLPGTVVLGVAHVESNMTAVRAHAWLSCSDVIVTGSHGYEQYAVVACYSVAAER